MASDVADESLYSLGEVADRIAIEAVIARYVHSIDARDYVSWSSGLEIVSPLGGAGSRTGGGHMGQFLKEHGEGPYALVFGVEDIEASKERIRGLGYEIGETLQNAQPWITSMDQIFEVHISPDILRTHMLFGEIKRKDGVAESR